MANRIHPARRDADNPCRSMPAAYNNWHIGDANSMSATVTTELTLDAAYTTLGISRKTKLLV
jgi:hypothetical protein